MEKKPFSFRAHSGRSQWWWHKKLLGICTEKKPYEIVSQNLGSYLGHPSQQFIIQIIRERSQETAVPLCVVLLLVAQSGRNFTGMGEAVVRVRCQICRTVVIKTGTLQRFIYWNIRRYEQFPVAVVIEMRADIERVWPLVNNLGSRITEDLIH